jgi:hypothetical protein
VKKCTQCGQILNDDTKFCFKCGGSNYEPIEEAVSTDQQDQPVQPPQEAQPVQSYYAQLAQPVQPPDQPAQPPQNSYYAPPAQPVQPAYQQQPSHQQQTSYQPQPAYQQPVKNGTVSVGMNFLFVFLTFIPIVGLIFAIIVAASSGFKKSYQNLARAWLIGFAILVILSIVVSIVMHAYIQDIIDKVYINFINAQ